jgi:hypothetical protein
VRDLYIDGRWRHARSGSTRDAINPFDRSVVAEVAEAGVTDAREAVRAARAAFDGRERHWTDARDRGRRLLHLAGLLERDRSAVARLETLDTGKTLTESTIDVDDVIGVLRYYGEMAGEDRRRAVTPPSPTARTGGLAAYLVPSPLRSEQAPSRHRVTRAGKGSTAGTRADVPVCGQARRMRSKTTPVACAWTSLSTTSIRRSFFDQLDGS